MCMNMHMYMLMHMHMHMHMHMYMCGFKNSKQNVNMREQQKYLV